jgi:2-oxo-4-hydroxy-4-carboxy-5-ureidoimidazoline decarboxylase
MTLDEFNNLDTESLINSLNSCCTSTKWQSEVAKQRPFKDLNNLFSLQEKSWLALEKKDFLEAFDGHPKIGDVSSLKKKYAHTKDLAEGEQSGVNSASDEVVSELSKLNLEYDDKFGYIFIVCATGKSALEMLNLLKERIENEPEVELRIAAIEQAKITKIRLEKLL